MVDVMSKIWCPAWSRFGSGVHSRLRAIPAKLPPAGQTGVQTRCTCSHRLQDASHTLLFGGIVCVEIKRQPSPVEMAARLEIFGPAATRWWRTLSSFPEAFARGDTSMSSQLYFIILRRLLGTRDGVGPIERSVTRADLRVRASSLCERTRSSTRSRYCAAASCFKYIALHPIHPSSGLRFRFPLPAHDCLTMGGNRS